MMGLIKFGEVLQDEAAFWDRLTQACCDLLPVGDQRRGNFHVKPREIPTAKVYRRLWSEAVRTLGLHYISLYCFRHKLSLIRI